MTYREVLRRMRPELCGPDYVGGCAGCPGDILPTWPMEGASGCLCQGPLVPTLCRDCWNREMPTAKEKA